MKRETDPLKLRNAFETMPDGCYNALMKAARSVKEEKPVKRTAFRTAVIAACIILAAMAAAVAAGSILGWNDFFKLYHDVAVPQTAQEIMAASQPESFQLGDIVFTVRERYSDAYLAMITTEAHLAEGVTGIITADAPFDPISAYGDNSAAVAARLGVDPGMTWAEAARQLNVPLYSVTAMLEVPEALCGSEAFADPLFNEDGSLSYFSLQPLNGTADAAQLVCQVWLRVERENLDDPEHPMNEWKAYEPLSIAVQPTLDAREYAVPAEAQTQGNFTLESVQAQLTPSGVHLIAVFAAQAGATEEKAYERLREVRFVQPDGSEYPTGMNLSGGISNLDHWPQVEVKQMIGTEKIPERIGMSFAGGQQPIQLTLKK